MLRVVAMLGVALFCLAVMFVVVIVGAVALGCDRGCCYGCLFVIGRSYQELGCDCLRYCVSL